MSQTRRLAAADAFGKLCPAYQQFTTALSIGRFGCRAELFRRAPYHQCGNGGADRDYQVTGPPARYAGRTAEPIVTSTRIKDNRILIWPREPTRREAEVKANFAPGLHVPRGQAANVSAYYRWTGRWSHLFVPAVISAAEVAPGCRVLDVSTSVHAIG